MDANMVTREDLDGFIERTLSGSIDLKEWSRLIVNHYPDEAMEDARAEFVRRFAVEADGDLSRLSAEAASRLRELAKNLR